MSQAPVMPTTQTSSPTEPETVPSGKIYGLMAEFDNPGALMSAAERVRDAGYRWWDCHTPFAVHGLDKAMGIKPTILPLLVFGGGVTGMILGMLLQWFTNGTSFNLWSGLPGIMVRGYDFLVSGKPASSFPTWIPVMFELTILFAALTAVGLMLLFNGLPRLYHPCFKSKNFARATDDRFFLVIEARDPKFVRSKAEAFLGSLDPLSIEALED